MTYRDAQAEAPRAGRPLIAGQDDPCGLSRVIRLTAENNSAASLSIAAGNMLLVDTEGRVYGPLDSPFVDIGPRGVAEVVVTFPALSGERGRPAALYIPGFEPGEWTLVAITRS